MASAAGDIFSTSSLPPHVVTPCDNHHAEPTILPVLFNPWHLAEQMFRGFCLPNSTHHHHHQDDEALQEEDDTNRMWNHQLQPREGHEGDSSNHNHRALLPSDAVPTLIQATQSTCSVSEASALEDDENEAIVNDHDDDDDDDDDENDADVWVIAETVSGTSRCVRIGKGLEIFACSVALLVITVWALKRFTGVDFVELQSKLLLQQETGESSTTALSFRSPNLEL